MAKEDFKAVKGFIKRHPNKKIQDRLKKIIALGNKKPKYKSELPTAIKPKFLTPEMVEDGIDNFEVVDNDQRFILVSAGEELNPTTIELLKQVAKSYPSALYVRQKNTMDKAGDIPYYMEIKEEKDYAEEAGLLVTKNRQKERIVHINSDEDMKIWEEAYIPNRNSYHVEILKEDTESAKNKVLAIISNEDLGVDALDELEEYLSKNDIEAYNWMVDNKNYVYSFAESNFKS